MQSESQLIGRILYLDKQLKYNKAKLGHQINLLSQNKAKLLKNMKSLDPEQFREHCNDRKLKNFLQKLEEMETQLKMYNYQLSRGIKVHKSVKSLILTSGESDESTASFSSKQEELSLSSSIIMTEELESKSSSYNIPPKSVKSRDSIENIIMEFLQSYSKPKVYKMEDQKLYKKNKTKKNDIKENVKRQGRVPVLTKSKRSATVARTKRKRKSARRRLLWKLGQMSTVKYPLRQTRRKSIRKFVKPQKTKSLNQLMISKKKYNADIKNVKGQDTVYAEKNLKKHVKSSPRKSHKSGWKKRNKKPSSVKGKYSKHLGSLPLETAANRSSHLWQENKSFPSSYSDISDSMDSVHCQKTAVMSEPLESAAKRIIDTLFKEPAVELNEEKRDQNIAQHLFTSQFTPNFERCPLSQVDDIYYDLANKNNELQAYVRDLEGSEKSIKSFLNKRYLQNLASVLHNQVYQITHRIRSDESLEKRSKDNKRDTEPTKLMPLRWSSFSWRAFKNSKSFSDISSQPQINHKVPRCRVLEMHRHFFCKQIKQLHKHFLKNDINHLYQLIMSREWPVGLDDRELLNDYALDRQRYNILLMAIDPTPTQSQCELKYKFLEDNFCYIMQLKENEIRREQTLESTSCQMSDIDPICMDEEGIIGQGKFNFNNSYVEEQRAKWANYFALKEKTPMEVYLEEKKMQKNQENAARKAILKRSHGARKNLQSSRSLSALYTAPRLTHRMQKALKEMAKEERPTILPKTKRNINTGYPKL